MLSQTRLILVYIMLILNLPSLLVWAKSLESADTENLFAPYNPFGIGIACASTLVYLIYYLKSKFSLAEKMFGMSNSLVARLVMLNCLLTVFFSAVSIYRLQYFILVHLMLTSFSSFRAMRVSAEKPKKE